MRYLKTRTQQGNTREGQRDFRGQCFLKSPPFSYSRNAHSLSFVGLGKFGANAQYGAESCVCPFWHPSIPGLPPWRSFAVVCYATKLADRKELHIKNPQKNP